VHVVAEVVSGVLHAEGAMIAGGGGGGAQAFTDLTDAPPAITAKAVVVGNAAGTAVEFIDNLQYEEVDGYRYLKYNIDPVAGGEVNVNAGVGKAFATVYAEELYASLGVTSNGADNDATKNATLLISADSIEGEVKLTRGGGAKFAMTGFDVAATDATATMTVDAVEYSIAKAVKVKIGNDIYVWPLYGPVVS
jgi:hypothetical protein